MRIYTLHGVWHRVQHGEDLSKIASAYHVDIQELAEVNDIQDVKAIKRGQTVYIPHKIKKDFEQFSNDVTGDEETGAPPPPKGAEEEMGEEVVQAEKIKAKSRVEKEEPVDKKILFDRKRFIWPVGGNLNSRFGIRKGRKHDGIDIGARQGTPIVAAADGNVVYSGRLKGYGNLILIKHKDGFFTAYAHNKDNLVKKDKSVKQGEKIALVGRTGRATGDHLHFEVRKDRKARNPLFFLPKR